MRLRLGVSILCASCYAAAMLVLAGCSGSGSASAPLPRGSSAVPAASATPSLAPAATPSPSPTATASSQAGLFANASPVAVGTASSPEPIPSPSSSAAYTLAQLATFLDASKPPPQGGPIGTIGIVKSTTSSSITIVQIPMIPPKDANGKRIPYTGNVPQTGDFSTPLSIDVGRATVFSNTSGLKGVTAGTMIAAGGTVDAKSVLHAVMIAPLAYPKAAQTSWRIRGGLVDSAARRPSDVSPDYDTAVKGAFVRHVYNVIPGIKLTTQQLSLQAPATCTDLFGKPTGATGMWSLTAVPQAVLSSGDLDIDWPFEVLYDKFPSGFTQTGNSFSGPGPANDWLEFNPTMEKSTYTVQLSAGADIGISLNIGSTCPNVPTFTLASATLGYAIYSATSDQLPGPQKKSTLQAISCIGLNEPLNINLFFDPASGFPNLNPFGDFTAANLVFCDTPEVSGSLVTGKVSNVLNGTINTTPAAFDPGASGSSNIETFGQFTPSGTPLSFDLTSLQYHPYFSQAYELQYTFLGVPIVRAPAIRYHQQLPILRTADVPVAINATPQGLCESVSGSYVYPPTQACYNQGQIGAVTAVLCVPHGNETCQGGVSSSTTVKITDPDYTGQFVTGTSMSGGCSSVTPTYPITITPPSGSGPSASYTISAGAQQVADGQEMDCTVYFEETGTTFPPMVEVQLLLPTPSDMTNGARRPKRR
jgi:hypothetical protein